MVNIFINSYFRYIISNNLTNIVGQKNPDLTQDENKNVSL